jgi:hypothetical protein
VDNANKAEEKKPIPFEEVMDRQPLLKYALELWKGVGELIEGRKNRNEDSRLIYVQGVLKQIQSALLFLLKDCVSGLDVRAKEKPKDLVEFYEESNKIFLSLWQRKFIESVVDVKLFRTSNDEMYYLHHTLLLEYVKTSNISNDFSEFLGNQSKQWKHSLGLIEEQIMKIETLLDIEKCWYLKKEKRKFWKDRKENEKKRIVF